MANSMFVALLDTGAGTEGQAMLWRIYRERNRICLQPASAQMQPIDVASERPRIQKTIQTILRHLA
jgi:hypothetical protein